MSTKTDLQTISSLVGDALSQFNKLLQNEIELAKAELAEKAQQISGALGFLAGGAVLVIPAIVMALFALSAALIANGWSQPIAYLGFRPVGSNCRGDPVRNRRASSGCAASQTSRDNSPAR